VDTALTAVLSAPTPVVADSMSADRFEEIVRQNQRRIYRVIFLLVRDADAADTLTQECFLRAYQRQASFRGECVVGTWLVRIAVNLARDHVKNRRASFWRRLVGLEGDGSGESSSRHMVAPHPSPEGILLAQETLQAVWSAVGLLSQQQQTIFLLRFAEEMSLAEIAATLGLKEGTVKAHLFRATSKVKEIVKGKSCS
jgi:RNA polymerase sigma-70 factor (ECF subfamily)